MAVVTISRKQIGGAQEVGAGAEGDLFKSAGHAPAGDDDRRAAVADDVLQLGRGMRHPERDGDAAGQPDTAGDGDVGEARGDEEPDARARELASNRGELAGDPRRGVGEIDVRKDAVSGDDGETVASDALIVAASRPPSSTTPSHPRRHATLSRMPATDEHRLATHTILAAATIAATMAVAYAQPDASNAVYRYRAAIAALMQIKPGMTVAEVGTSSNVLGSELLALVGSGGRVISAPVDKVGVTKLEPASVDAVALLGTLPFVLEPKTLFDGLAKAVKPGGVLLVVDLPQENDGKRVVGRQAEDGVTLAAAAGLKTETESGIVPGHYAIRFRKQ